MNELLALLSQNNCGEQEAIQGYSELLAYIEDPDSDLELVSADRETLIADLREIIADEMNHGHKLTCWFTKLSGIEMARD